MKFDRKQGERLYEALFPVAEECLRVLKPGGFALWFSAPRLAHKMTAALEDAGFEIRDIMACRYEGQAKAFTQDHFVRRCTDLSEEEKDVLIASMNGRKTRTPNRRWKR